MLAKRLGVALVCGVLFLVFGCGKEESDNRLVNIAIRQENLEREINQIATRMEGIENELGRILALARKSALASDQSEVAESPGRKVVDFKNTPEYKRIVAALSAIQQQLNVSESRDAGMREVSAAQQELHKTELALMQEQLKLDEAVAEFPGGQPETAPADVLHRPFMALGDAQELTEKLDSLAEGFARETDDPFHRQLLEAEVEQFKRDIAHDVSAQELYGSLASDLTQRWNDEEDETIRKWCEGQLANLESASPDQLDAAVARARSLQNLLRLRGLIREHNVPSGIVKNLGLAHWNIFEVQQAAQELE